MVRQMLSSALVGVALLKGIAQATNIYVANKCSERMTLAHVTPQGVTVDYLDVGGTIMKSIAPDSGSHVFKSGTGAEATLGEFSTVGGKCWYDISAIPTGKKSGPGHCTSLQDCKTVTGGVGFNVPIQITPHNMDNDRCVQVTCLTEDSDDAYLFPADDTKTHTCPLSTDFDLTFCPGGSSGSAPPAPPPVPAPSPTPELNPPSTPPPEPTSPPPEPLPPSPESTPPSPESTPPSPESTPPSPESTSPFPESTSSSPEKQSSSPEETSSSTAKTSSIPEKSSPSSPKQTPSLTTGSTDPTYDEQQSVVQMEEVPVPASESKDSYENLRKENGKTVTSSSTPTQQQTTETNPITQQTDDAYGEKNPAAALNKEENVQQISNRSADKSGGATFIFVGVVALCVVMVAAAAIMAVRKKKAQLEELESKTPQSTTAHGSLANFRTPRNNVSVL